MDTYDSVEIISGVVMSLEFQTDLPLRIANLSFFACCFFSTGLTKGFTFKFGLTGPFLMRPGRLDGSGVLVSISGYDSSYF